MSLLQKSSLVLLSFNLMLMVLAANHDQFNASTTTMASELSTSTYHLRNSTATSQVDTTETTVLNSSYSSSSNVHGSLSTFKLSNTSSLTSKVVMTGDNGLNKAEAREEDGSVKVISDGYVEVKITQLSIGVCLGGCYDDLKICYEAKNPSSDLPRTICGSPTQCGLRFGISQKDRNNVWFMEKANVDPRSKLLGCAYANILPGDIVFEFATTLLGEGAGCDPIIVSDGYTKIYVKGASEKCPVLIGNAQLKPEPTTVAPQSGGILVDATTPEASNFELYLGLGIGFGILLFIIIGVIIGVFCWRRRQAKQQKSPPQPMKAITDKTVNKDLKPEEPAALPPPLQREPEDKKEKSLLFTCRDEDVEKAEPVKKETTIEAKKDDAGAVKPERLEEAKLVKEAKKDDGKTVEAEGVEEVQPVKEAVKEKEQMLVVDETQEDSQQNITPPPPLPTPVKAVKKAAAPPPKLCRPYGAKNEKRRYSVASPARAPVIDDPRRRSSGGPRSGCKSSGSRNNYDSLREGRKPIDARFLESANQCLRNGGAFDDDVYWKIQKDYPRVEGRQMVAIEEELFLGSVDEMAQKAEHLSGKAEEKLLDKGFQFDDASKLKTLPPGGRRYLQARTTPHYIVAFAFGAEYDYHLKFADTSWRTVSIPLLFVIILTPRIPREARVKAAYQLRKLVMGKNWQDQSLDDKWFPVYAIGDLRKAAIEKEEAELKKARKISESKETKETTTGGGD